MEVLNKEKITLVDPNVIRANVTSKLHEFFKAGSSVKCEIAVTDLEVFKDPLTGRRQFSQVVSVVLEEVKKEAN